MHLKVLAVNSLLRDLERENSVIRTKIAENEDEELYLDVWKRAQADSPWFQDHRPYAPIFKEELDAAQAAFRDSNSRCWLVMDDGNAVGVLACRKGKVIARLGSGDREPAVLPSYRHASAGIKLLDAAFEWSIEQGLPGVFTILKLPPEIDPRTQWHVELCFQWGMKLTRLAVQLGARIHKTEEYANPQVRFKGVSYVGLDCFCDLILRSFESTRKFEYDPFVHDPFKVRSVPSRIYETEPDGMFVAYIRDEPVGLVVTQAPIPVFKDPMCGLIAVIGVLPEYREKKIGMSLLQKAHNYIIEKGYEYSFVGTSESNLASRALYHRMGYHPVYRILKFVKVIKDVNIPRDLLPHNFNELCLYNL